jgi:membrane protease YdiL (CAAX protease family)
METSLPATDPPTIGVPPRPWGLPAVAAGLALPLLLWAGSLAAAASQGEIEDATDGEIAFGLVLTIILDIALIGIAAWLSVRRYRLSWDGLGLHSFDRRLWWLPPVAAAGALVGIITYGAILTALGADAAAPRQEDLDPIFESRALLPLTGFAVVIMAPLAEEIFFRGFVFGGLIRPLGVTGAMVTSGVLFGVFHITSVDTLGVVLPFSVIGALFAWLYYRSGSLWPNIGAHFLFNIVGFAAGAAAGS